MFEERFQNRIETQPSLSLCTPHVPEAEREKEGTPTGRLVDTVIKRIRSGQWHAGMQVPALCALAHEFDCSFDDLQLALDRLHSMRLLVRDDTSRLIVSAYWKEEAEKRLEGFRLPSGERPGPWVFAPLIPGERLAASIDVAKALDIAAGEPVFRLERKRSFGELAVAHDEIYLPAARFPDDHSVYFAPQGALDLIAQNRHVIGCVDERISAVCASTDLAVLLEVEYRVPLLRIERTIRNQHNTAIELRITHLHLAGGSYAGTACHGQDHR